MRKVCLSREDFELFHQDITPQTFEFFRTHSGAFKRMWQEQSRRFWSMFVSTFEYFIWNYGVMKDFPMKAEEIHDYVDEIIFYIRDQFVDGKASTAKSLVMDCVIVTQNRHCIALLDKTSYAQNPFYMKETREIFRQLFGPPNAKRTFMKVLCGLPVYIKFAGAAVMMIRRWLEADDIPSDDEDAKTRYFDHIHVKTFDRPRPGSFDPYLALKDLTLKSKPKVPALEAPPPRTKKDKEKAVTSSSKKETSEKKSDAKTKKSSAKDGTSGKAKPESEKEKGKLEKAKPKSERAKLDSERGKPESEKAKPESEKDTPDSARTQLDGSTSEKPKLDGTKDSPCEEKSLEDRAGETEEQSLEGGTTATKKKRRRRKKKRGCAANDSVEDGLGLDEDLPSLVEVASDPVRDTVQNSDSEETHEVSEMEGVYPVAQTDVPNTKKDEPVVEKEELVAKGEELVAKEELGEELVTKEEELVAKGGELVAKGEAPVAKDSDGEDAVKEQEDLVAKEDDLVAKEEDVVAKEDDSVAKESCDRDDDQGKRERRLHICACCGSAETIAKSFKRCQKCRGKLNPCYYCSRECQAKHWKTHKLDHRND